MKINLVRFVNAPTVGKECAAVNHLEADSQYCHVDGCQVSLSVYDSTFLKITIHAKAPYFQLIPWAQVAGVFADELDEELQ